MTEENFEGEREFLEECKVLGIYLKSVVKPNLDREQKVKVTRNEKTYKTYFGVKVCLTLKYTPKH